jgi:serine/threonine protein kinase
MILNRKHVIGKGSYGKVYLVREILQPRTDTQEEIEGEFYAMKVLKKAELRK